ncbi:hypothetical protein A2972_01175 [Candidatus Amesbacteria bacterium RIFCSPLOWO2_01_FULL_47_33]|uniref:HIT domain-containing protein n=1 Tax=Candidatus Amesbacteria bacterium RIFCSPLOWO2_01_FULL_47_33 TaxID=1797258 RepID=A0A1F4Z1F7_9BACT|nr:MAG: hypothetical protein A2972_01175 [Candidatus Amesbacteria bacterium RIFCSPLOWO2_01_FULL_47_33]
MDRCIFCKIANGTEEAQVIYEDEKHLGFLDIFPAVPGQVVLITRSHEPSNVFELPDEKLCALFLAAKRATGKISRGLGVERVIQAMEGFGVDHAHIKLYPAVNLAEGGLIPVGHRADKIELEEVALKIRRGG